MKFVLQWCSVSAATDHALVEHKHPVPALCSESVNTCSFYCAKCAECCEETVRYLLHIAATVSALYIVITLDVVKGPILKLWLLMQSIQKMNTNRVKKQQCWRSVKYVSVLFVMKRYWWDSWRIKKKPGYVTKMMLIQQSFINDRWLMLHYSW